MSAHIASWDRRRVITLTRLRLSGAASSAMLGALIALAPPALAAPVITGNWMTRSRAAVVRIAPCAGDTRKLCGVITRLTTKSKLQYDSHNPDPRLRARSLVGVAILIDLVPRGDYWAGRVYDAGSGRTYRLEVRRKVWEMLEIRGCLAFFCKTQDWPRAEG